MPRINIQDSDLTLATSNIATDYAVFIPGLAKSYDKTKDTLAIYYDSLKTFKEDIGDTVPLYNSDKPDLSYVMAVELLGMGLPIIYKKIPAVTIVVTPAHYDSEVLETQPTDWPTGYYTRTGTGTEQDPYIYTPVASGTEFSAGTYYVFVDETSTSTDTTYNAMSKADIIASISNMNWEEIEDRGAFDVSFITSGGYPSIYNKGTPESPDWGTFATKLTSSATTRGDCFAIIDIDDNVNINKTSDIPTPVSSSLGCDAFVLNGYGAYSPSYTSTTATTLYMPGSFGYLYDFAVSIKRNASWFAISGVKRGTLPISGVKNVVTNAEADALQPDSGGISINSITYIKPYGYTIWGNRTLNDNSNGLIASSFINVRQLVHDIKRRLYKIARGLMFEQNNDILWVNFKTQMSSLLEQMASGQGIVSYRIVRVQSDSRATLSARIIITPIEAVENFELTVVITDDTTSVEG